MRYLLIATLLFSSLSFGFDAIPAEGDIMPQKLRAVKNTAFKTGETLKFKLHYGFINAGYAELKIQEKIKTINNRKCFHIVAHGKTASSFDWFYRVRDRYESYIDTEGIMPWKFIRDVNEDGHIIKRNIDFNQYKETANCKYDTEKRTFKNPAYVQDVVSGFFYARCIIDFDKLKIGTYYTIPVFLDYELYPLKIKYTGKETVKTPAGKFRCLKFKPGLQEGRIFKDEEDMTIYVSDDKNKIPIQVKADVLFGSVKLTLTEYKNLKNKTSSKVN